MRRLILGLALALAVASAGGAWGEPSLVGPTGLLTVPTADTLSLMKWNVGASSVWANGGPDESALYANIGLLPRLEIGFAREKLEDADAETLLNAKFRVLSLPGKVTLAVGVVDLTDQLDQSVYVVASHDLGAGIVSPKGQFTRPRVHAGVGGGRFDGLFGGVSVTVGGKADVMAEYDGHDVNVGVRWSPVPKVAITAAGLDGFDDIAAGVSVSSPW